MRLIVYLLGVVTMAYTNFGHAQCTDQKFQIYKKYDSYLESNPAIPDSEARKNMAKELKISPTNLRAIYSECIPRGYSEAREAQASKKEDSKTLGVDCKTLGYRFGRTAVNSMRGLRIDPAWDFVKPPRCNSSGDFDAGVAQGTTLK